MGMPATAPKVWTAEMWEKLPDDGKRYEIIDGELFVTPAPTWSHQSVLSELHFRIASYLRTHPVGRVLSSPADIRIDSRNLVQPDIFVTAPRARSWSDITSLLLAVEILSPRTARLDRARKRPLYQRFNVSEYWIVDAGARIIERWKPSDERPEILETRIEWQPDTAVPPLRIHLPGFFKRVYSE